MRDGLLESRTLQLLPDYKTNAVMRVVGGQLRVAGLLLGNQPPYGQGCSMLVGGGKVTVGDSNYGGEALIADRSAAELVIAAGVFRAVQLVVGEAGQGQLVVGPDAQLELESLIVARQEQSTGTAEFEGGLAAVACGVCEDWVGRVDGTCHAQSVGAGHLARRRAGSGVVHGRCVSRSLRGRA